MGPLPNQFYTIKREPQAMEVYFTLLAIMLMYILCLMLFKNYFFFKQMDLNINQVNQIVRSDSSVIPNLQETYSTPYQATISQNWHEIKCSLTLNPDLFCSQFSFRLAKNQPIPGTKDYWPAYFKDHMLIVQYAKCIIKEYFIRQYQPVFVNFSPAILIYDEGEVFYLYSSRGNFSCLNTSYLIHNDATFTHFFNVILPNYNLKEYIEDAIETLDRKYKGEMYPISIVFHCTKDIHRLYGSRMERGLSRHICTEEDDNDCLWLALSSKFGVKNKEVKPLYNSRLKRKRVSKKRSKQVKSHFKKWFYANHPDKNFPLMKSGYDSKSLSYVEEFLKQNVNVFHCKKTQERYISGNVLKTRNQLRHTKSFTCERKSTGKFKETTNLLAKGDHLQCVVDMEKYSLKLVCQTCLTSFSRMDRFTIHKCELKNNYRSNNNVAIAQPVQRLVSKLLYSSFQMDTNYAFVEIQNIDCTINATVTIKISQNNFMTVKQSFKEISHCARYLKTYMQNVSSYVLGPRLMRNLEFIAELELALNRDLELTANSKFEYDECKIRYNLFLKIKNEVMNHLKCISCFIMVPSTQMSIAEQLMIELLNLVSKKKNLENLKLSYLQGKLYHVWNQTYSVEFKLLNLYSSAFRKEKLNHEVLEFDKMLAMFLKHFGLNILQCKTSTQIGNMLISNDLTETQLLSFQSPSKILSEELEKSMKFGLIGHSSSIVHPQDEYKTCISLDITKFYLNVLGSLSPHQGHAIHYVKNSIDGKFYCRPSRNRESYSNIVLMTISSVINEDIYCSIYGKELRAGYGYPVDGILHHSNGHRVIISFNGCLFHPHFISDNSVCHLHPDKIDSNHVKKCDTCKSHVRKTHYDHVKPALFRMKKGEGAASKHPIKKDKSFLQVNNESKKNLANVEQNSTYQGHIQISECLVLQYFFKPMQEFISHLGLCIKDEYKNTLLCEQLNLIAEKNFPLLKMRRKLSPKCVVDSIRMGAFQGFVNVSCRVGNRGQKNLGIMKPFSFKDNQGKMQHSFEIHQKTVSTNLLRFLLNEKLIPDFTILQVHYLIEFKRNEEKPFETMRKKVMSVLHHDDAKGSFGKMLKESLNSAIGNLSFKPSNYNKTIPFSHDHMYSVAQLNNFVRATSVNDELTLLHFKNKSSIHNLSHIHCQLISQGKITLIKIGLQLQRYLSVEAKHVNTDGLEVISKIPLPQDKLADCKNAIILDSFIKPNLTEDILNDYIQFRFDHFEYPGVCLSHKAEYQKAICSYHSFEQRSCCKLYRNVDIGYFVIRIDFVGNIGLIKGCNRLAFYNTETQDLIKKCSGHSSNDLCNFEHCSHVELMNLLQK